MYKRQDKRLIYIYKYVLFSWQLFYQLRRLQNLDLKCSKGGGVVEVVYEKDDSWKNQDTVKQRWVFFCLEEKKVPLLDNYK